VRIVPVLRISICLALTAVVSPDIFAQEMRVMSPDQAAKFEARLRSWATTYYPAMVSDEKLPDDLFFAFLVDGNDAVLQHTAAFKAPRDGVLLRDELARVFPGVSPSVLGAAGGGCFLPKPGQPRRYCVYYAVLPK